MRKRISVFLSASGKIRKMPEILSVDEDDFSLIFVTDASPEYRSWVEAT